MEGEVGEVLEPLECPESLLMLSGSAVRGLPALLSPGPAQSLARAGWRRLKLNWSDPGLEPVLVLVSEEKAE